jgi:hypothetical protein
MRAFLYGSVALVLAACATPAHIRVYSQLIPTGSGEFTFIANADVTAPEDSPRYEAMRREVLDQKVTAAKLCPNGYTVERQAAQEGQGLFGAGVYKIYYRGRCKG